MSLDEVALGIRDERELHAWLRRLAGCDQRRRAGQEGALIDGLDVVSGPREVAVPARAQGFDWRRALEASFALRMLEQL